MFRRKNCSNYNFVHFVGKSNWPSSCITAEKSLIYSKNATLLLSHNTSLVLFFVKCGVLAEALERVLKLWIRLGRDAIFDTLKTECRQKFSRLTCPGVCRHPHYAGTQSMLPALCNPKKYAGRVFCNLFLSKNGKNIMCHFLLVPHTSVSAWLV